MAAILIGGLTSSSENPLYIVSRCISTGTPSTDNPFITFSYYIPGQDIPMSLMQNGTVFNMLFPAIESLDVSGTNWEEGGWIVFEIGNLKQIDGGGSVTFSDNSLLETIRLPDLIACGNISISNNSILETLALPSLESAGSVEIQDTELTVCDLSSLEKVSTLLIPVNGTIDFPKLKHVLVSITLSGICDTINLSSLEGTGLEEEEQYLSISISSNSENFTEFSIPNLIAASSVYITSLQNSLSSVSLSSLTRMENLTIVSESFNSLSLPSLVVLNGDVTLQGCALPEAEIDSVLALLVSISDWGTASQTVDLSGGTNAPPSASGLADKATLELRGATVLVNEE